MLDDRLSLVAALVLSWLSMVPISGAEPQFSDAASQSLIQSLRQGGYVLLVRHMSTDPTAADIDTQHLANCALQRQLTKTGRNDAVAMGDAWRRLRIPVGRAIASNYCRALDTARLAGLNDTEASVDVTEPQNVPAMEAQRRAFALRKLLATPPAIGTNTVIITHRTNILDAFGKDFFDIAEGEAAVFQPVAAPPGYRLVARVPTPQTWAHWVGVMVRSESLSLSRDVQVSNR
jgi:phosphohistidine phosphatase SixA